MFFVVGSQQKTSIIGPVEKRTCPNCRNVDFWELHELKDYFTFFWIRVLPYKTKYLLVCPVCRLAHPVEPEQVDSLRLVAERNMEALRG